MKFLTIRQPWASLIAVGAKTIETRPFSTTYRGPLAIHAGKSTAALSHGDHWGRLRAQHWDDSGWHLSGLDAPFERVDLPLGAVVAVCDLVDVVPMVDCGEEGAVRTLDIDPNGSLWIVEPQVYPVQRPEDYDPWHAWLRATGAHVGQPAEHAWEDYVDAHGLADGPDQREVTDQLPFGDFTPGRYAWLLDNVRPIEPVPMKGAQGLRDLDPATRLTIGRALGQATR